MARPRRPFLTARWQNLAIISYAVDPALLAPHVPPGCTLDTLDGRAFVSLVAFDFLDTRVLGVRWPGFVNFPEINLRIYVRGPGDRRGVSFIRELVPSRLIARIARSIYNEPYFAAKMTSSVARKADSITIRHTVALEGREHHIEVTGDTPPDPPTEDSPANFFKEHAWGYGTSRRNALITYEVRHPFWSTYANTRIDRLDWDFAAIYGAKWAFLSDATPSSVILAEGSAVEVFPKGVTKSVGIIDRPAAPLIGHE